MESTWKEISTAPKDGRKLLLWSTQVVDNPELGGEYWVGHWNGKWWDNGDYGIQDVTHWDDLPDPPRPSWQSG